MRIGFDAKRATHNFRGLGNYSRGLIEGLVGYYPSEELLLYSPSVKNQKAYAWINSLEGKALLRTPQTFLTKTFSSAWRSFLLASDLKLDHLDIFHGLSHEIPFGLNGNQPFKKIVTMHDLIFLRYPEFFPLIDRLVYKQKFTYACKNSDMVIAICEQTRNDLIQFLGVDEKKIKVHYQSCSPLFYQTAAEDELEIIRTKYRLQKPFILQVGAFEERKNQLGLLEAFAQISNLIDEDLVFIGQGKKYKAEVIARTNQLKLNHRVHFLTGIELNELPVIYQAAKIFCFPSFFEGFGIPIIEALFSKTPVITSYGSCFPESAGPDSLFIDPQSVSSIKEGLLKVLNDKDLHSLMRQRGYEFVQRFHQQKTSANLMDLYSQV